MSGQNITVQIETHKGSLTFIGGQEVITPVFVMRLKGLLSYNRLPVQSVQILSVGSWGANQIPKEERDRILRLYESRGKVAAIRELRDKYGYELAEACATLELLLSLEVQG